MFSIFNQPNQLKPIIENFHLKFSLKVIFDKPECIVGFCERLDPNTHLKEMEIEIIADSSKKHQDPLGKLRFAFEKAKYQAGFKGKHEFNVVGEIGTTEINKTFDNVYDLKTFLNQQGFEVYLKHEQENPACITL